MSFNLHSDKIVLRPIEPEDLSFLYQCENNTDLWKVSNTLAPYSKYVLKQYVENAHLDIYTTKQLRLIIELPLSKEVVGAIDLFDFDPFHQRAGIGIVINKVEARKNGYATEALRLLIEYCFGYLQLKQLYCNVGSSNNASIKLFKQAAFEQMADKKDWLKTEKGWESELSFQKINPAVI